ncbi:MAG: UbiD family decarboxylase [Planctomycetes bacterium]|nr:UbiD family decarboxylase [Planctomycetota bacterium]
MSRDLRGFLADVRRERPSDLVDIEHEVSPRFETAATVVKLEAAHRSPIVMFHRVAGCDMPLVSNVCGSLGRLSLALRCNPNELSRRYEDGCQNPIRPELAADGPVHEIVRRGPAVDLGSFPSLIYHEHDAPSPYVTAAIVAARDPETGRTNLSYHRLMIAGRDVAAIYMAHGKHLHGIYLKHEAVGRPMPVAAFIGAHPAWSLGALFTGATDVEEFDVIGGLLREPLGVVRCVTQPTLEVPANAELVLEGVVPPGERISEGPFGEFTGYATGPMSTPVLHVQAITSRRSPVFQDIVSGHLEHLVLPLLGMERHLVKTARAAAPGVERVKTTAPLTVFVAMRKSDDAEPMRVIDALLDSDVYVKHVVVVDAEVDVNDPRQVLNAIGLHVQPDRDVVVRPDRVGTPLDPSCDSADGRTAKMGVDATVALSPKRPIVRNTVPRSILDSIDLTRIVKTEDTSSPRATALNPRA